jgi:hypothetical protein
MYENCRDYNGIIPQYKEKNLNIINKNFLIKDYHFIYIEKKTLYVLVYANISKLF